MVGKLWLITHFVLKPHFDAKPETEREEDSIMKTKIHSIQTATVSIPLNFIPYPKKYDKDVW